MNTVLDLFNSNNINNTINQNQVQTVALLVESYNLDNRPAYVIGLRLDSFEKVKIYLDDYRVNLIHKSRHKEPPRIEFFAGKGQTNKLKERAVKPGGIILFNGVINDKNGFLNSNWAIAINHGNIDYKNIDGNNVYGDQSTISYLYGLCSLTVFNHNNSIKGGVNILLTDDNYFKTITPHLQRRLSFKGKAFQAAIYSNYHMARKYSELLFSRGLGLIIRVEEINRKGLFNVLAVNPLNINNKNSPSPKEYFENKIDKFLNIEPLQNGMKNGLYTIEVIPVLGAALNSNIKSLISSNNSRWISLIDAYKNEKNIPLFKLSHLSLYQNPTSAALVVSTINPQLMVDSYIGLKGAGFFARTQNGIGTDEAIFNAGINIHDFKIKYFKSKI